MRLGDLCSKIGSGATPLGGESAYQTSGVALVRSQNIYNDGFQYDGLAFLGDAQAAALDNVTLRENDVLLNITGDSVARACVLPSRVLPARVNQHVAIIRPKPSVLNHRFLHFWLTSPLTQEFLLQLASAGATRKALTKGMIEVLDLPDIPKADQDAIAGCLGALDDKIDLNRRTSQTLAALARTLFAHHFPPDPEEQLPASWTLMGLDELATFTNGLPMQKHRPTGTQSLPVIKIAELRRGITNKAERCAQDIPSTFVVNDGDLLFSWSGSLEVVVWCGGCGGLNQHLFKVTSSRYPKWLVYQWLHHHLEDFRDIANYKATTMGHIQRHHLREAKVAVPPPDQLAELGKIFAPLLASFISNSIESRTLAALRDALLPKLLSGEIRVPHAEKLVEATT